MLKSVQTRAPAGAWNAIRKLLNPRAFWLAAALLALCTAAASGVGLDATLLEVLERQTSAASAAEAPAGPASYYAVVRQDVSWDQADAIAQQQGGHLASVTTPEEWAEIQDLLDQTFQGQTGYVWLGARRDETGQFGWTTGEAFAFADWTDGEPSVTDRDGTPEPCLCAWNLDGQWRWNDQRSDLLSAVPSLTGFIGLVIEYETRQPA